MHPSPRLNTTANRRFFPKITTEYRFHPIHRQSTCHFHLTTAPTRRSSLKTIFSNSDRTDCTGTCMRHWYEKLAVTGMVIHVCCALPSRSLSSWLPVTPSSPRPPSPPHSLSSRLPSRVGVLSHVIIVILGWLSLPSVQECHSRWNQIHFGITKKRYSRFDPENLII